MTSPAPEKPRSLQPKQAWFLLVMAVVVVLMFAFVALPYVDKGKSRAGVTSGQELPAFTLDLLDGERGSRLSLADLPKKPIVLDFWASWCLPCREQMPILSKIASEHGGEFLVIGVATSDARDAAAEFAKEEHPSYPSVYDEGGELARALSIDALPTLVVIDAERKVRAIDSQTFTEEQLLDHVRAVLR